MNKPKYILLHCSDVPKSNRHQFYQINSYHRYNRKFDKSERGLYGGYHILINAGKEYRYRNDHEIGSHCNTKIEGVSMNVQSLAVCWAGDGDFEMPDNPDLKLLKERIKKWQKIYNIPNENVQMHRTYNPYKTCPGMLINNDWIQNLIKEPKIPQEKKIKQELIKEYESKLMNLLKMLKAKLMSLLKGRY